MIAGGLIDFAAFDPRIDKRAEADPRQVSWAACGNGTIDIRQLALRQTNGLRPALTQERRHPGHQAPVRADDALRQTLDGEMLEADLAIALAGGMHDDEISWMASLAKVLFDALVERLGHAHQRETIDRDRRAVGDGGDGLLNGSKYQRLTGRSRRRR